ncbi:uncharacterized protein LOC131803084 [Musca domestica]|uniref:Uncharacterized protein LOC131803084 n=1 Tax=Musca domestica TaxID=7370 RepID=A0ABM3V2L0_MUSDO|nr:uncharacterized protein LOC131803084 [Musca domestica]
MWFQFARELAKNAEIEVLINVRPLKSKKVMKFFDMKWNVCEALRSFKAIPMVNQIYSELKRTSNLPIACPLKANYLYKLTNLIIRADNFPKYTPTLDFNYTAMFFEDHQMFGKLQTLGAIVPRG